MKNVARRSLVLVVVPLLAAVAATSCSSSDDSATAPDAVGGATSGSGGTSAGASAHAGQSSAGAAGHVTGGAGGAAGGNAGGAHPGGSSGKGGSTGGAGHGGASGEAGGGSAGASGHGGNAGAGGTAGSGGNAGGASGSAGSVGGASGGGGTGGAKGDPQGKTARSVTSFLSTMGVCAHVAQGVDDPLKSAAAMDFAGIHNLRDDGHPETVPAWISMFQQSGVRVDVIAPTDIGAASDMAKALAAKGALLAVEGPNEPNNFPVTYEGMTSGYDTSFLPVAQFQRDLFSAIHAEPALAGIPVFHSSEAGGSEPNDVGLQFLTIPAGAGISMPDGTRYADYANTHNYVCGHSGVLVDGGPWSATDPTLNGDWDGMIVEYGKTWHKGFDGYSAAQLPGLPKVSTETGWLTSGKGSITEEQQARVFLDLYLSAFLHDWSYTFVYMLRDDPVQGYWGMFDVDYAPKTSGRYLHNLTTILADTGEGPLGKLDYSVLTPPPTVHDLLLQKSDGTFALVVWSERLTGGSDEVTVDLTTQRPSVTVYDPTTGTGPVKTLTNVSQVTLTLTDHPFVLEL